MPKFSVEL